MGERLLSLTVFSDIHHLERLIVECARNNDMQVRIDHRTRSVHFGTDLAESQKAEVQEGPHIQAMPSEQVWTQLMSMMSVLNKSLDTIHPDRMQIETAELRTKITEAYHQSKVRDHQRLLARHKIIEERKEWLENVNNAKMEDAVKKQQEELTKQKMEEAKRLAVERELRDKERKEQEFKAIQAKHNQDKIKQLAQTDIGKKVLGQLDQDTIAQMDADDIMAKQVEELEKEKKQDHIERAKRLEELPLLKLQFEEFKEEAKLLWEEQERERIEEDKLKRASDVANRDRMARMKEDKDKYLTSLLNERKSVYEKKAAEHQILVEEERKIRLEKRREERVEDRRRRWRQEREEEEQKKRDEIALQEKEEREAREAEEREREKEREKVREKEKAEEYEKRKAEMDEIERMVGKCQQR